MAFDGIVTHAVAHELNETIAGGRITKVRQPTKQDMTLTIRAGRVNHTLLLSVNSQFARVHLTEDSYEQPAEPPMFCMMLRKHLDGAFLRRVEQAGMERMLTLVIDGRNDLGDPAEKHVHIEIMGKHANILLVDPSENRILDAIKHLPPSVNSFRTILPGQPYIGPPAQDKLNPLTVAKDDILRKLDANQGRIDRQLVHNFSGISPLVAGEITHRAGLGRIERTAETFLDMMQEIQAHTYNPCIAENDGKEYFSAVLLTRYGKDAADAESISRLLDKFYSGKAERDRVKQRAHDLERLLKNEWEKNERKITKLEETQKQAEATKEAQKYGELLTAHMHLIQQGMTEVEVMDYYDEESPYIKIALDEAKTPSENAQSYFSKYTKAKNSERYTAEQIEATKAESAYLERLLQQLDAASPEDVAEIREELEEEGYVKQKTAKKKRKKQKAPVLDAYESSEGIQLFVGKNNKQNEYLSMRYARQSDTWLHTKDIPGSHVLIRAEDFSEETLQEAAVLAAYFSKARESSSVPVDYTLIRHVRKPKGAKPGFVTYDNQKTIFVTPDSAEIQQLKNNTKKENETS
ncbi:putative ribosome quality control (RQC) complex YloA/Tae2 family protein [Salsuginibacillus halophilus]|uniref:Rqc2 homolog RqcH n=1 Tax=Salsuginibacillus halophilus TaxID=517424 RepID=A0A2P8HY65_9BACI|nr:NFACT RNA binding domain-containing protein [Salsuginibacillus halophilus]PSL51094.1 putative ribosome quality control (RQC) complex YloA/Tae2 family protein [Salsuginibacillus halophilus]